jgi:hypothetical protein
MGASPSGNSRLEGIMVAIVSFYEAPGWKVTLPGPGGPIRREASLARIALAPSSSPLMV